MLEGNVTFSDPDEIGGGAGGATGAGEAFMFPAAAVLVFLLYILLFHELISQFIRNGKTKGGFIGKGGSTLGYRWDIIL